MSMNIRVGLKNKVQKKVKYCVVVWKRYSVVVKVLQSWIHH